MANVFGLNDNNEIIPDRNTGESSNLKTGGRREYNMPSKKKCAELHKVGSEGYNDCIAYKNTKNDKSNPKVKVTKGY